MAGLSLSSSLSLSLAPRGLGGLIPPAIANLLANPAPAAPTPIYDGPGQSSLNTTYDVGNAYTLVEYVIGTANGVVVECFANAGFTKRLIVASYVGDNASYLWLNTNFNNYFNVYLPGVGVGDTFKFEREITTGNFVFSRKPSGSGTYTVLATVTTAAMNAADPAIVGNSKILWRNDGGTFGNVKVSQSYVATTPLAIGTANWNALTVKADLPFTYTSADSTALTVEYRVDGGAWMNPTVLSNTVVSGTGSATIRFALPPNANPSVDVRTLKSGVQRALVNFTIDTFVPDVLRLGMNWGGEQYINDFGSSLALYPTGAYTSLIAGLGDRGGVRGDGTTIVPASTDGLGGTVLRTLSGGFGGNSLGYTQYTKQIQIQNVTAGTYYDFTFRPGVTCSLVSGADIDGFNYDPLTGAGYFRAVNANTYTVGELRIDVSSITGTGGGAPTDFTIIKRGATGTFNSLITNRAQQFGPILRNLDAATFGANGADYNTRTLTALPSVSTSMLKTEGWTVQRQIDLANLLGKDLWYQVPHIADQSVIDDVITRCRDSLTGRLYIAHSNEVWNFQFTQTTDAMLQGTREGMAPLGATPGTLVPETVYDGAFGGIDRGDWSGTAFTLNSGGNYMRLNFALPAGGKFFLNMFSTQVYTSAGALSSGAVINMTTAGGPYPVVSGGSGNVTVLYDADGCQRALKRWHSSKTKFIRDRAVAVWGANPKPRPFIMYETQVSAGFTVAQEGFDWNNNHLYFDYNPTGPYYGIGTGDNTPLGLYTDAGYPEWGPTTGKGALYDRAANPLLVDRIAAAKTAYFSASAKSVQAVLNATKTYYANLRTYLVGQHRSATAVKPAGYEFFQHVLYFSWPDAYPITHVLANTYNLNDVVRSTGNGLYIALQAVPASTAITNTTYWRQMATEADFAAGNPSDQLYRSILGDDRERVDYETLLQGLRNVMGGPGCGYKDFARNVSSTNYFGHLRDVDDVLWPMWVAYRNVLAAIG